MAAAWVGGLGAVVLVAVVGAGNGLTPTDAPPASLATAAVAAVESPAIGEPLTHLMVDSPSRPGAVITTRNLIVRGSADHDGPIRVTLESSGAKLLLSAMIDPSPAPLLSDRQFEVAFPLSNPRPGGRMVVQVVALSPVGIPIEVARIPIEVGAIAPATPREVGRDGDGGLGEDGIIGGIVFGNAWDPEALAPP